MSDYDDALKLADAQRALLKSGTSIGAVSQRRECGYKVGVLSDVDPNVKDIHKGHIGSLPNPWIVIPCEQHADKPKEDQVKLSEEIMQAREVVYKAFDQVDEIAKKNTLIEMVSIKEAIGAIYMRLGNMAAVAKSAETRMDKPARCGLGHPIRFDELCDHPAHEEALRAKLDVSKLEGEPK